MSALSPSMPSVLGSAPVAMITAFYAFGFQFIVNDGISEPELWTWDGSQYDAIVSLRELYHSSGVWTDTANQHLGTRSEFFAQEDHVLFELNTLGSLKYEVIHTMEQDFGVLPYPKYTREQANFQTGSIDNYTAMGLPYTHLWNPERLRMTGALIEALSAENCNTVKKPYYDDIITHHNVTDGDSAEMIDIIMDGRHYNLAAYHYYELKLDKIPLAVTFRELIRDQSKDIIQHWSSNSGSLLLQLYDLLDSYASIGM